MNQLLVPDTAKSDLDEIWFYIAQDNPDAADKLIRAIVPVSLARIHAGNGTATRGIGTPVAKFSGRQLRYLLPSDHYSLSGWHSGGCSKAQYRRPRVLIRKRAKPNRSMMAS